MAARSDAMLAEIVEGIDAALEGRLARKRPPPWLAWLAVALVRQRARQSWHRSILESRLQAEERRGGRGEVPGLSGWNYYFHGMGCCLTGPDGEELDVDRRDDRARVIDPYFFARRIETVRSVALPEVRLWRWMPSAPMIVAALTDLRKAGALVYLDGDHCFVLAEPLENLVGAVTVSRFDDEPTCERWLAAFDDRDRSDIELTHQTWVRAHAMNPKTAFDVLDGARKLLPLNELAAVCTGLLSEPPGPAIGKAIAVLREMRTSESAEIVAALVERLSPTADPAYAAYEALAYLLEHRAADAKLVERFTTFAAVEKAKGFGGNPFLAGYAVLALRFLPSKALALVRRALRCNTPLCVGEIATLLAVIGQPWCVRELTAALAETPDNGTIAAALQRCGGRFVDEPGDANLLDWLDEPFSDVQRIAEELRARYPGSWNGG